MASLTIECADREEKRFTLQKERTSLGRHLDNDIVIDDEYLSRFHAEIRATPDGRMELADLESHNGTKINGKRIKRPVILKNGDILRFGLIQGRYEKLHFLETAFLPRSGQVDSSPPNRNMSTNELSGVVLSFEEFDSPPMDSSSSQATSRAAAPSPVLDS